MRDPNFGRCLRHEYRWHQHLSQSTRDQYQVQESVEILLYISTNPDPRTRIGTIQYRHLMSFSSYSMIFPSLDNLIPLSNASHHHFTIFRGPGELHFHGLCSAVQQYQRHGPNVCPSVHENNPRLSVNRSSSQESAKNSVPYRYHL